MLAEPRCFTRRCRWYEGVRWLDATLGEASETNVCPAFPEGIPDTIAYGDDPHLTVHPLQVGLSVFREKETP